MNEWDPLRLTDKPENNLRYIPTPARCIKEPSAQHKAGKQDCRSCPFELTMFPIIKISRA